MNKTFRAISVISSTKSSRQELTFSASRAFLNFSVQIPRQPQDHNLRLIAPPVDRGGVGAAGSNYQPPFVHTMVVLGKQPLRPFGRSSYAAPKQSTIHPRYSRNTFSICSLSPEKGMFTTQIFHSQGGSVMVWLFFVGHGTNNGTLNSRGP